MRNTMALIGVVLLNVGMLIGPIMVLIGVALFSPVAIEAFRGLANE